MTAIRGHDALMVEGGKERVRHAFHYPAPLPPSLLLRAVPYFSSARRISFAPVCQSKKQGLSECVWVCVPVCFSSRGGLSLSCSNSSPLCVASDRSEDEGGGEGGATADSDVLSSHCCSTETTRGRRRMRITESNRQEREKISRMGRGERERVGGGGFLPCLR